MASSSRLNFGHLFSKLCSIPSFRKGTKLGVLTDRVRGEYGLLSLFHDWWRRHAVWLRGSLRGRLLLVSPSLFRLGRQRRWREIFFIKHCLHMYAIIITIAAIFGCALIRTSSCYICSHTLSGGADDGAEGGSEGGEVESMSGEIPFSVFSS